MAWLVESVDEGHRQLPVVAPPEWWCGVNRPAAGLVSGGRGRRVVGAADQVDREAG